MHSFWKREPVGVCAGITPWNFPLILAIYKIAPALAMGNSIVLKPASITPVTTLELAKILSEAGVPPGVFNVITGPGSSMGNYLAGHPEVDKIAFTGSTEVGRQIAHQAADTIKRVTLELGGKSPIIVLDDADMEVAANMCLLGFLFHSGQVCESGTRLFVPRSMQDELVERMIAKIKKMVIGNQLDMETDLGPIASQEQLNTICRYVQIGKEEGAQLAYGGNRMTEGIYEKGFFHEPTIFINCNNKMTQVREEIFGPVQCVIPYDDVDEAIAWPMTAFTAWAEAYAALMPAVLKVGYPAPNGNGLDQYLACFAPGCTLVDTNKVVMDVSVLSLSNGLQRGQTHLPGSNPGW